MWIGAIEFDILLGDVRSLKEKRAVVRPLIAELRRRFELSVAEVGSLDLHRRAAVGVAMVARDARRVIAVLDQLERLVAEHPEFELVSTRRVIRKSTDTTTPEELAELQAEGGA